MSRRWVLCEHFQFSALKTDRYDSRTTIFSPEGRLFQVEYALEAISHAGTALGVMSVDGIVLAAEKKIISKLLEKNISTEKIYVIDDHMICAVAGVTADANILINYTQKVAQQYLLTYGCSMPCEEIVKSLCNVKQGYTQYGEQGLRPFGVSFLWAGYDPIHGFQLYQSNPSGNYGGWKATCIGANSASAQSLLKQEYKETSLKEACSLAIKVLSKTVDSTTLSNEKIEFATIGTNKQGKIFYHIWTPDEIDALLRENKLLEDVETET